MQTQSDRGWCVLAMEIPANADGLTLSIPVGRWTPITKDLVFLISLHIFVMTQLARMGGTEPLLTSLSLFTDLCLSVADDKSHSVAEAPLSDKHVLICLCLPLFPAANATRPPQARHEREAGSVQSTPSTWSLPGVPVPSRPGAAPLLFNRSVGTRISKKQFADSKISLN